MNPLKWLFSMPKPIPVDMKNIKIGDKLRHIETGEIIEICNLTDRVFIRYPENWEKI